MIRGVAVGGAIFVIDQASKGIVFARLTHPFFVYGAVGVAPSLHSGGLFASGFGSMAPLLFGAIGLAVLTALFFAYRSDGRVFFSLCIIGAGAASNIADRLFFGGVRDWITVTQNGVFNVADVAIVAGCATLFFKAIRFSRRCDL